VAPETRNPAAAGFRVSAKRRLLAAGAHDFDFHATVLRAAFGGLVVGDRLLLALAFGVDAILFDALADQKRLDGFRTPLRRSIASSFTLRHSTC